MTRAEVSRRFQCARGQAARHLAAVAVYSKEGTKSREFVQNEIDIYREASKLPNLLHQRI